MAPEIRRGELYNGKETDVFALGVLLFSIVTGHFPFNQASRSDIWFNFLRNEKYEDYFSRMDTENRLSDEFKDLIVGMLKEKGSERLNLDQIRAHAWIHVEKYEQEEVRANLISFCTKATELAP